VKPAGRCRSFGKYDFTDIMYVGVGNPVMIVFSAGSDQKTEGTTLNL